MMRQILNESKCVWSGIYPHERCDTEYVVCASTKKKRTANIVNLCRKKRITHTSTSDCNNKIPRFELEYMFNHVQRHTTCTDYFFLIKKKWVCCQFFCMLIFHCTDGRNESQIIQLLNNCDRNKCGIPNIFLHIDFYCALHIRRQKNGFASDVVGLRHLISYVYAPLLSIII